MPDPRQAIVIIHGMGEQHPMAFLRQFVRCLLARPNESYFSKPDTLARTFEVRRFALAENSGMGRPRTDLYEYYWAHHMVGNSPGHLWPLIRAVLLRFPWNVSPSLRVLWLLGWSLAIAVTWTLATRDDLVTTLTGGAVLGLLLVAMAKGIQRWVVGSFGDAARYLSPAPSNVAIRQTIRAEATELLEKLQASGRGQPDCRRRT